EKDNLRDPTDVSDRDRAAMLEVLDYQFGTPAEPRVYGIDKATRDALKLNAKFLDKGSQLYRIHCLHCHGLTGNGRGPTARWVNPHPRDFRQGLFKFSSSGQDKPRRDDLLHTLHHGVEGTAMQSYNLMPERDLEGLASYVIHLSIRGEAEFRTLKEGF